MSKVFRVIALALVVSGSAIAGANAAVVFSDNFNSDAYQLDWTPPASLWTVPRDRSVGLIGETTTLTASDFDPGNGGYVDLGGSTGAMRTSMDIAPGTYTLSFELGGNTQGDATEKTKIRIGDWSTAVTLSSSDPLATYTYTFTTTGGHLWFRDFPAAANQSVGNILDNVVLSIATSVPEPSTWAMMTIGFAGLGFVAFRSTRNRLRSGV
jgi:PEP-CTERM motif